MSGSKIDKKALRAAVVFTAVVWIPIYFLQKSWDEECYAEVLNNENVYLVQESDEADDYVLRSFKKDDPERALPGSILAWFASTRRELVQKCIVGPVNGKRLLTREEILCLGAAGELCISRKGPPLVN